MDMTAVIQARSDQWNATDFAGGPQTFTIESVSINPTQDQPVAIKLVGESKVWRPCKTTSRILVSAYGADATKYAGKSVTLYCDPAVVFSAQAVGGIRISHLSHIDGDMKMTIAISRAKRAVITIHPLRVEEKRQAPPAMSEADAIAAINATTTLAELQTAFTDLFRNHRATADLPSVKQAKDDRKAALTPDLPPAEDDEIPL